MLYLTEISLPLQRAVDATLLVDPLVATDLDYVLKTWLAGQQSLAPRPWRAAAVGHGTRITGWRAEEPTQSDAAYMQHRAYQLEVGSHATFSCRFIPVRRAKQRRRDAAADHPDPLAAYQTWLRERLIDVQPGATVDAIEIVNTYQRRVLRKFHSRQDGTRMELIPVAEATIMLTVTDPSFVEKWLLTGVGPQRAFGYGAALPVLDPRDLAA